MIKKAFSNPIKLASILLPLAVLIYTQYRLRYFTWDDSYITYRHALNMARGFGPVYNPGELADGITNYLLTVILAIGLRINLDPELFSKWIGVISACALLFWMWIFATKRLGMSHAFSGIALLLLASNGMYAVESMGGLETSLFALLIFWILWEVTAENANEHAVRRLGMAGIASGIAMLMRPDAFLFVIAIIPFLISKKNLKTSAKRIFIFIIPILLIYLPYFIHHWIFFGYPFPNSYYAKKVATLNLLDRGFSRLITNLKDISAYAYLIFILAFNVKPIPLIKSRESKVKRVYVFLLLFILARLIFIWISGGSWMGWGRFLVPILPMFYLIAPAYFEITWSAFNKSKFARAVIILFVIALIALNLKANKENLFLEATPSLHLDRVHIPLGLALKDILTSNDSISFGDAGALPYYADVINIDPAGLCDRHIAHLKGEFDVKTDPDYIFDRKPAIIILNSINPYPEFNPQSPIDKKIVSHPRLTNEYEFILGLEAWSGYNLWLFARRNNAEYLKTAIMSHPRMAYLFR